MSFFFSSGIAKSVKTGMFTLDTDHSCFPKRITRQETTAFFLKAEQEFKV